MKVCRSELRKFGKYSWWCQKCGATGSHPCHALPIEHQYNNHGALEPLPKRMAKQAAIRIRDDSLTMSGIYGLGFFEMPLLECRCELTGKVLHTHNLIEIEREKNRRYNEYLTELLPRNKFAETPPKRRRKKK